MVRFHSGVFLPQISSSARVGNEDERMTKFYLGKDDVNSHHIRHRHCNIQLTEVPCGIIYTDLLRGKTLLHFRHQGLGCMSGRNKFWGLQPLNLYFYSCRVATGVRKIIDYHLGPHMTNIGPHCMWEHCMILLIRLSYFNLSVGNLKSKGSFLS